MIKIIPVLLILMMTTSCALFSGPDDRPGQPVTPSTKPASLQLTEGRAAFDQKITDSKGINLAALRQKWGSLEPGVSRDSLTVYRWSQTAQLTPPAGMVTQASTVPATSSCLAMFIVDPKGNVMDAASEGQCFDYSLMPAWKPIITQSTDGKTGVAF